MMLVLAGCGGEGAGRAFVTIVEDGRGYKAVYHSEPPEGFFNALKEALSGLPKTAKVLSASGDFLAKIGSSKEPVLSIIAHSSGGFIYFENGGSLAISTIVDEAARNGKVVAVIGCDTLAATRETTVGIGMSLTLTKAVEIQSGFHAWADQLVAGGRTPTAVAAQDEIERLATSAASEYDRTHDFGGLLTSRMTVYRIAGAGTGASLVGVSVSVKYGES
jgi:hypothetical protein